MRKVECVGLVGFSLPEFLGDRFHVRHAVVCHQTQNPAFQITLPWKRGSGTCTGPSRMVRTFRKSNSTDPDSELAGVLGVICS